MCVQKQSVDTVMDEFKYMQYVLEVNQITPFFPLPLKAVSENSFVMKENTSSKYKVKFC